MLRAFAEAGGISLVLQALKHSDCPKFGSKVLKSILNLVEDPLVSTL